MSNFELQAINDLLEYAKKIGELNQKTIFRIEDYKKSTFFEIYCLLLNFNSLLQ